MKLVELLSGLSDCNIDLDIAGLTLDSRKVSPGDVFIGLRGANRHGFAHAEEALAKGAVAVIYDPAGLENVAAEIESAPLVAVKDLNKHLGRIAAGFYGYPSKELTVIGVTGTNGKTTCSQLIAQSLPDCGVIGTLGWGDPGNLTPSDNTTPDALAVQKMLKYFADQHKTAVVMEVSSHGLHQGRVNAVDFTGGVFTNLSRDHLDYHLDMESYLQAKLALFANPSMEFAVINLDDLNGLKVLDTLGGKVRRFTFSVKGNTVTGIESVTAENIRYTTEGIYFQVASLGRKINAFTPITGYFNLENVLAVLGVLLALDTPFADAVERLAKLEAIAGRMEKFGGGGKPTVFVDYAHSPDALEKVLKAAKGGGRTWVVFGCGGNRDKGKRAEMGRIAADNADEIILTDDNPRMESSAGIINDILDGCQCPRIRVISNRTLAIQTAIEQAAKDDCVLVAGKGHENYQEINGVKYPFSDQEVVRRSLAVWSIAQ